MGERGRLGLLTRSSRMRAGGRAADCTRWRSNGSFAIEDSPNGVTAAKAAGLRCASAEDGHRQTKPDPALYTLALERLGAEAQEAFAIEDSPNGVTAAKAAGLRCVVVPNPLTAQMSIDHADLRLGSLAEMSLAEVVAALAG